MNDQEKIGAAVVILKMIANTKPHREYKELSYNCGGYQCCDVCEKLISLAAEGLKAMEPKKEN